MRTYEYRGYDLNGVFVKGFTEALSVKEAREKLLNSGVLAEKIMPVKYAGKMPVHARALLYREVGTMLAAGMTLMKCFELLLNIPEIKKYGAVIAALRDKIREGQAFYLALATSIDDVSAYEKSVIEAGEKSGVLDKVLCDTAEFFEEQERFKDKVRSAMIYPLIVVTAGICVALLMLGVLLPKTESILQQTSGVEVPLITSLFIKTGNFLKEWGILLLAIGISAVVLFSILICLLYTSPSPRDS